MLRCVAWLNDKLPFTNGKSPQHVDAVAQMTVRHLEQLQHNTGLSLPPHRRRFGTGHAVLRWDQRLLQHKSRNSRAGSKTRKIAKSTRYFPIGHTPRWKPGKIHPIGADFRSPGYGAES